MPKHLLYPAIFLVGLAVVGWIGAGYLGTNLLALAVVLLITACYVTGALELRRYRQATGTLARAVEIAAQPVAELGAWLGQLHPSLRDAVRQRVDGGRSPLPAPALTPYLVGLLVLLGMLGTLLGMMTTLRGTGLALESASDLAALRASIAAPVKGLAFAFGTSIAGVAASAMLGLLAALSRRERVDAAQALDTAIATTLRPYSQPHQREEMFKLLQRQADTLPTLVAQLQATLSGMEQQSLAANERQLAQQAAFHERTEAVHTRLAASVKQSLLEGASESARATGTALQPVMEATMSAIARNAATLHENAMQAVQQQVAGLASEFQATTATVAGLWTDSLAEQRQANATLLHDLRGTLEHFNDSFEQRSSGVVDAVSARFDAATTAATTAWDEAAVRQTTAWTEAATRNEAAWSEAATRHEAASTEAAARQEAAWADAVTRQTAASTEMATRNQAALEAAASTFEAHAAALVQAVQQSHIELHAALDANAQARMVAWAESFDAMTRPLVARWESAGERAASRQQDLCDTLARTADAITAQTQAHARDTIAEISRLVQAASEAPKAAAEVIAELRQRLSDSMARDTAVLEERGRLLATVDTLLNAVNHASTEQRAAVDALISTSADLLDRVGNRFAAHVEAETGKLDAAATRIAAGAIEVASLGDAFGAAVQRFGESNDQLVTRLQAIEAALDRSLSRSDEQLAYYVAQAREVIDLSMLAQKQIIGELQHLSEQRAGAETA
ncbi:DUF802 domain-containing protein [Aerolutibacter ruishenii]|uniref:Uncharacterized protein DUF802 n=1 Tax=Aerolutibacter ruishenii TaxID=686800 RepID=A0A562LY93_9GAMM|nr:DUF802 domain-containing protein [Lysobacter ruishenii]TWI12615.1 uncharacterized protein DUF802 [Lysobacter ruishenii]